MFESCQRMSYLSKLGKKPGLPLPRVVESRKWFISVFPLLVLCCRRRPLQEGRGRHADREADYGKTNWVGNELSRRIRSSQCYAAFRQQLPATAAIFPVSASRSVAAVAAAAATVAWTMPAPFSARTRFWCPATPNVIHFRFRMLSSG